jgi:hypothetical protein
MANSRGKKSQEITLVPDSTTVSKIGINTANWLERGLKCEFGAPGIVAVCNQHNYRFIPLDDNVTST